jgi:hypothetical protein
MPANRLPVGTGHVTIQVPVEVRETNFNPLVRPQIPCSPDSASVPCGSEPSSYEVGTLCSRNVELGRPDKNSNGCSECPAAVSADAHDPSYDCGEAGATASEIESALVTIDVDRERIAGQLSSPDQQLAPLEANANRRERPCPAPGFELGEKRSLNPTAKPMFHSLHEAVDFHFVKAQVRNHVIAEEFGISASWISALRRKFENGMASRSALLQALETRLGAPPGTFTQFTISPKVRAKSRSKFVKRLVELRAKPQYRLHPSQAVTPILHLELVDLTACKTNVAVKLFDNGFKRGRPWRSRDLKDFHRLPQWMLPYCTTCEGTKVVPTATMFLEDVCAFFGSLNQIDPYQYDPAKYSLVWMCSADLMEKVVAYLVKRFKSYGSTIDNIVMRGNALINPEHGFVTQNTYFADRLPPQVQAKNWLEWSKEQHARFLHGLKTVRELGTKSLRTRDPKDAIKEYLNWQHPIEVIEELITRMTESLPTISGSRNRACMRRDILLVRMLAEQPLRALMYGNLTCTPDNLGSLYKQYKADGSYLWAIRFAADDFKNWRTAQQKNYDVCFSPETSDEIDTYFREVRNRYPEGPRVFTVWENKNRNDDCKVDQLERTILLRTESLLDGCVGFGMNAFRNIVATEIIQNYDGGYQIAADVLHDEVETVKENYADIKAKYGHSKYVEKILSLRQAGRAKSEPEAPVTIASPSDAVSALAQSRGISYEQAWSEMNQYFSSQRR